jgi:hypothetical protein
MRTGQSAGKVNSKFDLPSPDGAVDIFGICRDFRVPRPGVEPGLEVPETSVMSFSLPGLRPADQYNR